MPFTFTMPKLSPTMDEGTIVKWHKQEGEFVAAGDVVLEIATDKATVEHTAIDEGYLVRIIAKEDVVVRVNQPLAVFTEEEGESIEGYQPEGEQPEPEVEEVVEAKATEEKKETAPVAVGLQQPAFTPEPPLEDYHFLAAREAQERLTASPLAKRLAKEQGLDLRTVKGSGPHGRIVKEDLARAQPAAEVAFGLAEQPTLPPGSYEEVTLTPMRKVIGQRLQESKSFVPHFYVTQQIDAAPLMQLRQQLKEYNLKLSVNDFIVRAAALALRNEPKLNSGFNTVSQKVIQFQTVDIAVAVSVEQGLLTPIIRHADYKNIGQISLEVKQLAKRARDGKLQPEEYRGGSFTISNLGMYGVFDFKAVINPPQAAILAVGGILSQPVVCEGQVVPGHVMKVTIAADHRVVDGADVAQFLVTLQRYLENPAALLV